MNRVHPGATLSRGLVPTIVALLVCLALPFVLTEYQATLAGFIGIAAIAALGLVLLTGVSGQTSFGHATFVGLAAYTTAWMTRYGGWPPLAGLVAGLAVTGGAAFLLGLITSRISGHYLPVATIAWCSSFFYLFGVLPGLGGFNGFGEIPPLFPGISRGTAAALIGLVLIAATVLCANLLGSRTGRAMRALAQSRVMAESLGIDTARLARSSFVLAALLAGVAGWLFAHVQRYISPAPFGLSASIEYVFMIVIGGAAHLGGAILGAAIVVLLRDQLNDLLPRLLGSSGNFETVAFSLVVIALLRYAPGGIAPALFRGRLRPAPSNPVGDRAAPLPSRDKPPHGTLVLAASALEKRFGGLVAARAIDLAVHAGEIVALIGPNGAGKSTTFNLLSGALAPDAGRIQLTEHDVHGSGARAIAWRGLARTFQHVKLLPEASVLDNIALGAHQRGRAGMLRSMLRLDRLEERALLRTAREQAARVGLDDVLLAPVGSLPLGRQRLVEIARGLCLDPLVFLLDEPAAGLRLQEKQALAGLLRALRGEAMAILLVEHDMDFVMGLADRVVVMDFGEKIADGRPDQVQDDPIVQEAYLGGVA
ncbi:ABC transporter permease subunit [Rhodopila sp.]|uniref:branched-chain amino acid ABC transporter ATP-binding protein/permease n=1 Tax=Rhodopila sp. TaxID=2480087 RepID=UPI003D098275